MHRLVKAKPKSQQNAEELLDRAERSMYRAFLNFIREARGIDAEALIEQGDFQGLLDALDIHIERFAAAWAQTFVDIGTREAESLQLTQKARKATVSGIFQAGDPDAAALMQRARLNLVTNLTNEQRRVISNALADGLRRGLGTRQLAELFRDSIGLTEAQQRSLDAFRAAQRSARVDDLRAGEELVPNDAQIERLVRTKARQLQQARAETVARTEALRIASTAREQALRQSIRAVGQSETLTGKEWSATHDSRTRQHHADADGQRRRLNEPFDVGGERIMKPGDGSPGNSVNCRCQILYFFADSEEEMTRWLQGSA